MRYLITALAIMLSSAAWSASQVNIYQASQVLRADASEQAETAAMRAALLTVMIRATGNGALTLDDMPLTPRQYIPSYGYQDSDEVIVDRLGDEQPTQRLVVDFDPNALQRLAAEQGWGFWPNIRPDTLLWVMVEEGRKRAVSASDNGELAQAIKQVSEQRGLATSLPLWDAEDQFTLPESSLWGLYSEDIQLASQRYESDWLVAIKLVQNVQAWQARVLVINDDQRRWQVEADSPQAALTAALNKLADQQAELYAFQATGYEVALLEWKVAGINSYDKYRSLLDYLDDNVAVLSVLVDSVDADLVTLKISSAVRAEQLLAQLALEGRVQRVEPEMTESPQFEWHP